MNIHEQMRSVKAEIKAKIIEREKNEEILKNSTVTSTAAKFNLRPRKIGEIPTLLEITKIQQIPTNEESSELVTARIPEYAKIWILNFSPLFAKTSKRSGLGTKLQQMIQEITWHRSELREHLHEVRDYLRQVQNAEKDFYFQLGREGEKEASLKFQKAIKYLELVLNLKRLKYEKMMVLFQKGYLDQVFVDEIHYYMNIEVYEKWSARGF